jgi:two-component sensor histidine kinase
VLNWLIATNAWSQRVRWAITGAAVAAATFIQLPVSIDVPGEPFLLNYIVAATCTLAFGRSSGIFAIGASSVLSVLFFTPAFSLRINSAADLIAIEAYAAIGTVSVVALARMMASIIAEREAAQLSTKAEQTSRLMLKEMGHRVANNFAAAATIIRQKSAAVHDTDAKTALDEAFNQIHIFASIHSQLRADGNGIITIDSKEFIGGLCEAVGNTLSSKGNLRLEHLECSIPLLLSQAVPLGLIINELLTNSAKYAFPRDRSGTISVSFNVYGNECCVCVADDGKGFDGQVNGTGKGLRLVKGLSQELGGNFEIESSAQGTIAGVRFPVPAKYPKAPPETTAPSLH